MNWQTKVVQNWIEKSGLSVYDLSAEEIKGKVLQELGEQELIFSGTELDNPTKYMTNIALQELLKDVKWEELVYNSDAWYEDVGSTLDFHY